MLNVVHLGGYLPDRTGIHPKVCYSKKNGWFCTLPPGHPAYCPHMAGTGATIAAIWYDAHDKHNEKETK